MVKKYVRRMLTLKDKALAEFYFWGRGFTIGALALSLALPPNVAMALIKEADRQTIEKERNYAENPGAENGVSRWEGTGSSTLSVDTSSPLEGDGSFKWDASATGEFMQTKAGVTIADGLKGRRCQAETKYLWDSGTKGHIKFQVYDGTNVHVEYELDPTSGGITRTEKMIFDCPQSGTMRLRYESTANATEIEIDNQYLGEARQIDGPGAELIVNAEYSDASCFSGISGAFADFPTAAACGSINVLYSSVSVDTTDNDKMDLVLPSLPAGRFKVTAHMVLDNSAAAFASVRITDGTTPGPGHGFNVNTPTNFRYNVSAQAVFEYSAGGDRTFTAQGFNSSGTLNLYADSDEQRQLVWTVERFPLDTEKSISFTQADWHLDVNIGGATVDLGSSNLTAYTEITNGSLDMVINPGSASARIPCSGSNPPTGLTCSAGDESLGVVFTPPFAGKFEVCGMFSHQAQLAAASDVGAYFEWIETPTNDATTLTQESNGRVNSSPAGASGSGRNPVRVCGQVVFNSVNETVLRLMREQTATGTITANTIRADRAAAQGQQDIHITVRPVTQFKGGIRFDNMMSSSSASGFKTCSGSIANSGTPTVTTEEGDCIDTLTDIGLGQVDINFTSGIFSGAPHCTVSSAGGSNSIAKINNANPTASVLNVYTGSNTIDSAQDHPFHFTCMGPK